MRGASRLQALLGSIRLRILAAFVVLLALAAIGSTVLDQQVLYRQLDDEIRTDLRQEAEEFRHLAAGNDPETGEPFAGDLRAIFDVYFDREVPDEGESILALSTASWSVRPAPRTPQPAEQLTPTIDYWLSLTQEEAGAIDTPTGRTRYVALPLDGRDGRGVFVVAKLPRLRVGRDR